MNKGIVIKQQKRYTIVVDQFGNFRKVPPIEFANPGEEVLFEHKEESPFHWTKMKFGKKQKSLLLSTMVTLIFSMTLFIWLDKEKVYAFVNLDINPSFEIAIKENMRIKAITPLNNDARELLEQLRELKGERLHIAADEIISKSIELGMGNRNETVLIGISYTEGKDDDYQVSKVMDDYFTKNYKKHTMIATFEVPNVIREQARQENISMNRIMASNLNELVEGEVGESQSITIDEEDRAIIQSYYNESQKNKNKIEIKDNGNKKQLINKLDPNQKSSNEIKRVKKASKASPGKDKSVPGLTKEKGDTPPGLAKEKGDIPPGLAKEKRSTPPGLKKEKKFIPPGLEKEKKNKKNQ